MAGSSSRRKKKVSAHHGFYVTVMVTGWLLPPLAVAMRFGIGRDFFINIILTLCGYIPGHVHNFYLQNIRNNKGRGRTPKWAIKYGLVKDDKKELARKREWANRYAQNHGENTYDEDGYEDEFGNHVPSARSGSDALERGALERSRKKRMESNDGVEHDLYGPTPAANDIDSVSNGSRDPSRFHAPGFDLLPGAGDRDKRTENKGIKGLMGRDKSGAKDRFARMEDGRQQSATSYDEPDEGGNEDWLNQDPLSGPRRTESARQNGRSSTKTSDPLPADWLDKQDIYPSSMAQGERRTLDRPKAAKRTDSERLVDTTGDLDHRF